jgi:hypothetical protein
MDLRMIELTYRMQHRHDDGSWQEMTPDRPHHDPSEHDPERPSSRYHIFRCTVCDEVVTMMRGDGSAPGEGR